MAFPVVMYGCESWTMEKVEHQRTDAFELWCWRRLLRARWTARRSDQSTLKGNLPWIFIGRTGAEVEASILWPPDEKSWLIKKDPDSGKHGGQEEKGDDRGWDVWMASVTQWTWAWVNWKIVIDKEAWHAAVHGVTNSQTWLSDWTTTTTAEIQNKNLGVMLNFFLTQIKNW